MGISQHNHNQNGWCLLLNSPWSEWNKRLNKTQSDSHLCLEISHQISAIYSHHFFQKVISFNTSTRSSLDCFIEIYWVGKLLFDRKIGWDTWGRGLEEEVRCVFFFGNLSYKVFFLGKLSFNVVFIVNLSYKFFFLGNLSYKVFFLGNLSYDHIKLSF